MRYGLLLAHLVRRVLAIPIALLMMAGSTPPGLRAGSEPFDNTGRIPCDANGRIAPSGLVSLGQRPPRRTPTWGHGHGPRRLPR